MVGVGITGSDTTGASQRSFGFVYEFDSIFSGGTVTVALKLDSAKYDAIKSKTFSELEKVYINKVVETLSIKAFK